MDIKLEKIWSDIKDYLLKNPDLQDHEIASNMKLNLKSVKNILTEKYDSGEVKAERNAAGDVMFYLPALEKEPEPEVPQEKAVPEKPVKAKVARRKPYTPIGLKGFHLKDGEKITMFLDRKNTAKSITFTKEQLGTILEAING